MGGDHPRCLGGCTRGKRPCAPLLPPPPPPPPPSLPRPQPAQPPAPLRPPLVPPPPPPPPSLQPPWACREPCGARRRTPACACDRALPIAALKLRAVLVRAERALEATPCGVDPPAGRAVVALVVVELREEVDAVDTGPGPLRTVDHQLHGRSARAVTVRTEGTLGCVYALLTGNAAPFAVGDVGHLIARLVYGKVAPVAEKNGVVLIGAAILADRTQRILLHRGSGMVIGRGSVGDHRRASCATPGVRAIARVSAARHDR
eukprot:scaffold40989_cov59-Phaeocystis_antarctica.AAC.1